MTMASLETKSFDRPDETRPMADHGRLDVVRLSGITLSRGTLEPGWRWSEHVRPVAGTASCRTLHQGVIVSGRLHVVMDDGASGEAGPGDAYVIQPGHDAWVVGDEPVVFVDMSPAMETYARAG
jgi:hypothetical protein